MTDLATYFAALYVSEIWHKDYRDYKNSSWSNMRRYSNYARARAVILFDRIITDKVKLDD